MEFVASEDVLLHQRNLEEGQDDHHDLSSSQATEAEQLLDMEDEGRLLLSQSQLQPWVKGSRSLLPFPRQLSQ